MELKKITEDVYYVENATNIGVIKNGGEAILVDSGLDDDTGRRVLKVLEGMGLRPSAIINTHAHADHCGANDYIKRRTGALLCAPEFEADLIQHPLLSPLAFYSFASPPDELRNKFMMAKPSIVDRIIRTDERQLSLSGVTLGIVPLPGHAINQIGVEFDGALFCADSLLSEELLIKHKLPVNADIGKHRATLRFLLESKFRHYVPSHAEPATDISGLAEANLQAVDNIEKSILDTVKAPTPTDEVIRKVCEGQGVEIRNAQHYFLMRSVAMAYLSHLCEEGCVRMAVEKNILLWVSQ